MKKLLSFYLVLLSSISFSQSIDRSHFINDSLDIYMQTALEKWQIPGAAVCIVKNGEVIWMKGYGVKEMDKTDSVDENTLFMIGSNTKAFTATALAMLNAEKKLSLDDKVTKWLPGFKLDNEAAGEQAIIRDMLCHRIGFRTFQGDFTYWTSNLTRSEVIEKMSHIKATYPFRTTWGYTNAAFLAAGEIIPKATGMQWEEFITQRIFKPLGMNNSLALSKDFPAARNRCTAHSIADGKLIKIPFPLIDNLSAAGSIGSSIHDMSHWVMTELNRGKYMDSTVIPPAVINETWMPHSIMGNGGTMFNTGHFKLYGLGWMLEEYAGKKIVSHTGGVNGFVTSVTLLPEEKLGVIVFTNTDQNALYEAAKLEIVDAYLGLPFRDYSKVYLGYMSQQKAAEAATDKKLKDSVALNIKPSLPLVAYTGSYFNDVYGNMSVVLDNGKLKMKFSHHPDMYASLESMGNDRFYAVFSDPIFSKAIFPFHINNGKVTGVTVKVADFVEYNPYEFIKK